MASITVFNNREVKATKKVHTCWLCLKSIKVNSRAYYRRWIYEGEFTTGYFHTSCKEIEELIWRSKKLDSEDYSEGDLWYFMSNYEPKPNSKEHFLRLLREEVKGKKGLI